MRETYNLISNKTKGQDVKVHHFYLTQGPRGLKNDLKSPDLAL